MSERAMTFAAVLMLLLAGAGSYWIRHRDSLQANSASLSALPIDLGSFRGVDTEVGENVEAILDADHHVQREYTHAVGDVVWLYIGYYGTERGGTPEHTPRTCYQAQGWSIVDSADVVIDSDSGTRAVEYLVRSGDEFQLVLYWYRSFRASGLTSTWALRLDHVLGKVTRGRGDGALIRLSTPLVGPGDRSTGRMLLTSFARELELQLAPVWPNESAVQAHPSGARSAIDVGPLENPGERLDTSAGAAAGASRGSARVGSPRPS